MAKLKGWKPEQWEGGAVKRRPYRDEREYVEHQKAAAAKRHKAIRRFEADVERFSKNFAEIAWLREKKVLCLGCRTGAEVMALRELGNKAFGIDIEPVAVGEAAKYVMRVDFHDIPIIDGYYEVIYTNSFDHVRDLKKALSEVQRILSDDGRFILEIVAGYEEGGCPGDHEAMYWRTAEDFIQEVEKHGFKRTGPPQKVPYVKGLPFTRVILAKGEETEEEWTTPGCSSGTTPERP